MKLGMLLGVCLLGGFAVAACTGDSGGEFEGSGGSAGSGSGKGGTQGSSGGRASGGEGNGEAGAGATTGGSSSSGSGGSGGKGGSGAGGSAAGEGGSGNGGAPFVGDCPDVFRDYTITEADGTCGDLDDQATVSFEGTDENCFLHFVSEGALNGGADLDENGEFSGAQLYVGTAQRSPCSAEYDLNDGTMVVTCGGAGDSCTVTLEPQ